MSLKIFDTNCIRILTEKTYPEPIIRGQRSPTKIKNQKVHV